VIAAGLFMGIQPLTGSRFCRVRSSNRDTVSGDDKFYVERDPDGIPDLASFSVLS
jgi:hypothetical protein